MSSENLIPLDLIENQIYIIRGHKVMLSTHLAELYEVEPKALIQAVKRNIERFPEDFMFQLTKEEDQALRSQIVTLKRGEHSKYLPYAFTEQGVAMLSSVLRSSRAVQVNIQIMRTFVQIRQLIGSNKELALKIEQLEKRYDEQFKMVFDAIRELMTPVEPKKNAIGFRKEVNQ
jgi:cell division protein FtsL